MRRICLLYLHTFLSNQNDRDFGNDFDKYLKVPLIKYKFTVRDVFCFKWYIYSSELGKKKCREIFDNTINYKNQFVYIKAG